LFQIDADVLPEIRQLQSGANVIGEEMQLLLPLAVQQQDEPADRVRAAAAIIEHFGKIRVAAFDHVLLESREQVGEEAERQIEFADRLMQRDENKMQLWRSGRRT